MSYKENIEKIFIQDSREKKRTGASITKRASRRGYCRGGIKFPSDYLTAKEKKKMNGEVKVSHVLDNIKNIPSIKQIKAMEDEEARKLLNYIKSKHKNEDLLKHFGITIGTLGYYYRKYGCDNKIRRKSTGVGKYKDINEVPRYEEIKKMPVEKQYITCSEAKIQFGATALARYWGKSTATLHGLFTQLGIYESNRKFDFDFKEKYGTWEELINKPIEEQNKIITELINVMAKSRIIVEYGISSARLYNKLKELELYKNKGEEKVIKLDPALEVIEETKEEEIKVIEENKNISTMDNINNGFKLEFAGIYKKDKLEDRLNNLSKMIIDDVEYIVKISLEEVIK